MAEHTLDAVGIVSAAKMLGTIGLLWGLFTAITWLVLGGPLGGRPGLPELALAIVGGLLYGAIGGAKTAIVYHAAASPVGASTSKPRSRRTLPGYAEEDPDARRGCRMSAR